MKSYQSVGKVRGFSDRLVNLTDTTFFAKTRGFPAKPPIYTGLDMV